MTSWNAFEHDGFNGFRSVGYNARNGGVTCPPMLRLTFANCDTVRLDCIDGPNPFDGTTGAKLLTFSGLDGVWDLPLVSGTTADCTYELAPSGITGTLDEYDDFICGVFLANRTFFSDDAGAHSGGPGLLRARYDSVAGRVLSVEAIVNLFIDVGGGLIGTWNGAGLSWDSGATDVPLGDPLDSSFLDSVAIHDGGNAWTDGTVSDTTVTAELVP